MSKVTITVKSYNKRNTGNANKLASIAKTKIASNISRAKTNAKKKSS